LSDRAIVEHLGSEQNLGAVAGRLFAAMRDLDARGADVMVARGFGEAGLGLAILDRLTRAAARGE
jgi:L-threonylcarbamoyladenylate synthase